MTKHITTTTSLKAIKTMMRDDFNVELTNAQAKEIRESRRINTSTWTTAQYINTANSARIKKINEKGVRHGMAHYTIDEWNKAVLAGEFE